MTRTTIGKYINLELIGQGGMAEVYIGVDPTLNRKVAIKLILPHFADKSDFEARFQREAETIASLRHANIIQIYEYSIEDGTPFMVMEYLAGGTLKDKLAAYEADGKIMSLEETAVILDKVANGLDYAHQRGIIHRDIKPANILFSEDGEPIIADFGIVKLLNETAVLTQTGGVVGSPRYLPPEQATQKPIDKRSDIYSLGIVVYQMVTGQVPFDGDMITVMMQHVNERPTNPTELNTELPVYIDDVILKALEKDPQYRFASAGEMALAFRQSLVKGGILTASFVPDSTAFQTTQSVADTHTKTGLDATIEAKQAAEETEAPPPTNNKMIIGGLVAFIVIALLAFVIFGNGFGGGTEKTPTQVAATQDSEAVIVVATEANVVETAVSNQPTATESTAAELTATEAPATEPTATETAVPTEIPIDTTISRGDVLINGPNLSASFNELIPLDEGAIYAAWLTEPNEEPLFLGTVTEGQALTFTAADNADLLASFSGFVISEEPETDGEPSFSGPIIFEAAADEQIVIDYRHLQETIGLSLSEVLNERMIAQANTFTDHTGFCLRDILINGNLTSGKNHAEHTINIASGTASEDFFDWDGNGRPENPGDDVGLLPYVRLFANAVAASDPEQAEAINELIAQIENHVSLMSKITASDTLEEAATHAEQLDAEKGEILATLTALLEESDTDELSTRFEVFATGN